MKEGSTFAQTDCATPQREGCCPANLRNDAVIQRRQANERPRGVCDEIDSLRGTLEEAVLITIKQLELKQGSCDPADARPVPLAEFLVPTLCTLYSVRFFPFVASRSRRDCFYGFANLVRIRQHQLRSVTSPCRPTPTRPLVRVSLAFPWRALDGSARPRWGSSMGLWSLESGV